MCLIARIPCCSGVVLLGDKRYCYLCRANVKLRVQRICSCAFAINSLLTASNWERDYSLAHHYLTDPYPGSRIGPPEISNLN